MASAGAGRVPVGIAMPQFFQEGPTDMELLRRWVARAEELDFDSLWTQEDITGDDPSLEPLTQLSYVAALTDSGTAWVCRSWWLPLRNPVQLAKALGQLGPDEPWASDSWRGHRRQAEHVPRLRFDDRPTSAPLRGTARRDEGTVDRASSYL